MQLEDVKGFVFDVDGSLVHRGVDFRSEPLPGAVAVIEAIRASGRPLVLFTNGSHLDPETFAAGHCATTGCRCGMTKCSRRSSAASPICAITCRTGG